MTKILRFTIALFITFLAVSGSSLFAQPFQNEIPIPYTVSGNTINLEIQETSHNFDPEGTFLHLNIDLDTTLNTNCYNVPGNSGMSYLGPTMIWEKGQRVQMHIDNNLSNDSTTVHWHGLNIPSHVDGGPHQSFQAGTRWSPEFPVIDSVQTIWYHSHLMDFTTEQVIRGQAGMIIIENPQGDPYRTELPHEYGLNDFPIIVQEKGFQFDTVGNILKATSLIVSEKPGNGPYTLINGVVNGSLKVPAQVVRLRFLNGSPRKAFHMGISPVLNTPQDTDFETIYQMGTDGGYMALPHPLDSFLLSVGERKEMLVDLSSYDHGDTVYLNNLIRSVPRDIITGGRPNDPIKTPGDAFMAFIVDTNIQPEDPILTIPASLQPYTLDSTGIFRHRTKRLMGGSGTGNTWTINGEPMNRNKLNDTVLVGAKEKWTIVNTTDIAHPFHIHKIQFQIVEYTGNTGVDTGDQTTYTYPNLPFEMMGYKDDILVRAGATVSFIATFDRFPDTVIKASNGYMYHCHILTHEDNSMMHQFTVVDSATYFATVASEDVSIPPPFIVYPNPVRNRLTVESYHDAPARLRIIDIGGRVLREHRLSPFTRTTTLDVTDITAGLYFLEWTSGDRRHTSKVMVE